ncbi:MAG: SDR family oxidoreductase, partial [Phycisphaerae bacterium]
ADVAICARRAGPLDAAAERLSQTGRRILAVPADVTIDSDRQRIVETTEARLGPIEVLVNNAGTTFRAAAEEMSLEQFDRQMDLNVRAAFGLTQLVARGMIKRRRGRIIFIASLMSEITRPGVSAYTASKGAIKQLTKSLATEWARYGIRVNAIGPGYIATPLTQPLRDDAGLNEWVLSRTPLGRWGRPEDLVGAAVFLASEASEFVTGQVIYVDGGFLIGS